jgi:hypothetical protein
MASNAPLVYTFDTPEGADQALRDLRRQAKRLGLGLAKLAVVRRGLVGKPRFREYHELAPIRPSGLVGLLSGLAAVGAAWATIGGLLAANRALAKRVVQPLGFDRTLAVVGLGGGVLGMGLAERRVYPNSMLLKLGEELSEGSSALVLSPDGPLDQLLVRFVQQQGGQLLTR